MNDIEKQVEEFKKRIGYATVGSQPVLAKENSDVIIGAFMVGIHQTKKDTDELWRGRIEGKKYDLRNIPIYKEKYRHSYQQINKILDTLLKNTEV